MADVSGLSLDITSPHPVAKTVGLLAQTRLGGQQFPRKLLLEDIAEPGVMTPGHHRSRKLSPPVTASWETGGVTLYLGQGATHACVVRFTTGKPSGRPTGQL